MWSPADKSALPTPEELNKAKEAINSVQRDLESAIELLAHAQLRVEILRKDLEERKAWIAPVRRIAFDVLSMIFEWCADVEWDSPLRIAAVSCTWRSIVLDTPRAWSFLDLSSNISNKRLNLFFERSRERPLHVFLPESRQRDITSVAHRIHCLSFKYNSVSSQALVFLNLQQLSISGGMVPITAINPYSFPALLQLVTVEIMLYHTAQSRKANLSFPQLKGWSLRTSRSWAWVAGLRSCQNTLVSLTIYGHSHGMMDEQPPILLPVLKCLKLMTGHVSRGRFNLKTPRLETYGEDTDVLEGPIHTDVSTVTLMRFVVAGSPSLSFSFCLGLKRLQICNGGNDVINLVLDQLLVDGRICPALQVIELLEQDINACIASYSERLMEINSYRDHTIDMVVLTDWADLPDSIPLSCGDGMACTHRA